MSRRTCVSLVLVGAAGLAAHARPDSLPPSRPQPSLAVQGVSTCAAAGCHHANGPPGSPGSEYSTWASLDPHARAYDVLRTARSVEMMDRLGWRTKAHEDVRCLGCHATTADGTLPRDLLADGVGCESCHGPAQRWRTVHYQGDWLRRSLDQKAHDGLVPLKDLAVRAQTCAGCHVGAPGREVNHDLIAAGHPRLAFEFAAYHALYPRHWPREPQPDFAVRAWEVGQAVSARAAAELLRDRAERAVAGKAVWPELSESGCFACHHDLKGDTAEPTGAWRRGRRHADLKPGSLPWGSWYFPLIAAAGAPPAAVERSRALAMKMAQPYPPPAEVAGEAARLRDGLDAWTADALRRPAADPRAVAARLRRLIADGRQPAAIADWEHAAQHYLGLAALYHGLGDLDPAARAPARQEALRRLSAALAFPRGYDSPPRFAPEPFRQLLGELDRTFAQ